MTDESGSLAQPSPSPPAKAPKKRRRVAIACASCRLRKTKCHHIIPKTPIDTPSSGLSAGALEYIRSLEYKLQQYEQQGTPHHSTGINISPVSYVSAQQHPINQDHPQAGDQQPVPISRVQNREPAIVAPTPEIFLGGHSGISFTQLILNALNPGGGDTLQVQSLSHRREHGSIDIQDPNIYSLPPDVRDSIKRYFDFHHALCPIFHVPTIFSQIEATLSCDPPRRLERRNTLAIINMMCAISRAHSRTAVETSPVYTRKFYDRAMTLMGTSLFYDWTIGKLQIVLMGARYLHSSNFHDECWSVLGLAIRLAYGLELHRPPKESLDYVTKEVHKRLWYACFTYDQHISMIYGRPTTTSSSAFTTPLPADLDDDCIQPDRLLYPPIPMPSGMAFSIHLARLSSILEKAAALDNPPFEKIAEMDDSFQAWYNQLPHSLRVYEQAFIEDDKALIMALRANMVRILIHRHSLASTLTAISRGEIPASLDDSLKSQMLHNSRQICVQTAEDTIQLVGYRYEQTKKTSGASFYNSYYLFNAILIIASHIVDPDYRDDKKALSHLDRAMLMISQMSVNHEYAQTAHIFLQQLLGLINKFLPSKELRPPVTINRTESTSSSTSGPHTVSNDAVGPAEFFAFWDNTQNFASALGSHLELYTSVGTMPWSWGEQIPPTSAVIYTEEPCINP